MILLLTLKTFSATGGIEKMCRVMAKALHELHPAPGAFRILSMHDRQEDAKDNRYVPDHLVNSWGGRKLAFIRNAVAAAAGADTVILSHINLLPVGWLIKKRRPAVSLVLMCHGIEVWSELGAVKKAMLPIVNRFFCVSTYTRDKMESVQRVPPAKLEILHNCLDPFLLPPVKSQPRSLMNERYGFDNSDVVMLMLSRLAATERHKHYDTVIASMPAVMAATGKKLRYLIAGKYTDDEAGYIMELAKQHGVAHNISLAGFVPAAEIPVYFCQSDMYVMPSSKEGFGIVFIEAMYYGLPVLAGNADGSKDALLQGALGIMVTPGNPKETIAAMVEIIQHKAAHLPDPLLLQKHFGYQSYKQRLQAMISENG